MTLTEIEKQVKEYSDARKLLRDRVENLEDEIRASKKKLIPGIRSAVESAKEKHAGLKASIEGSKDLFVQPRTLTLFGIKFGLMKQKGALSWGKGKKAAEAVVKLLKRMFPEGDGWKTYVKTTEEPMKKTLSTLTIAELKKLGVEVTNDGDAVVIEDTASEIDKLVDKLLDEKTDAEEEQEAA